MNERRALGQQLSQSHHSKVVQNNTVSPKSSLVITGKIFAKAIFERTHYKKIYLLCAKGDTLGVLFKTSLTIRRIIPILIYNPPYTT